MNRLIVPEQLDTLPPSSAAAARSRRDLQRLNLMMGHAGLLARAVRQARFKGRIQVIDLGAGDGHFSLRWVRQVSRWGLRGDILLVDQHVMLPPSAAQAFEQCGWTARPVAHSIEAWVEHSATPKADLVIANLFLHHFSDEFLRRLFGRISSISGHLACCEPERGWRGLAACSFLRLIGCGPVTRHDAPVSVRAGFTGKELSRLWPDHSNWDVTERPAGLFSHLFTAAKKGGD